MPCNSNYMMPTTAEKNQSSKRIADIVRYADTLVAATDVLSEFILSGRVGDFAEVTRRTRAGLDAVEHLKTERSLTAPYADATQWKQNISKAQEIADYFQEVLSVISEDDVDDASMEKIAQKQIAHRRLDLRRCINSLGAHLIEVADAGGPIRGIQEQVAEITEKLIKIIAADPDSPLDEQLGFDPDNI